MTFFSLFRGLSARLPRGVTVLRSLAVVIAVLCVFGVASADPTVKWAAEYDGGSDATAVVADPWNNVIVMGYSEAGSPVVKYDADGNKLWDCLFAGWTNYYGVTTPLAVDATGNVYATGLDSANNLTAAKFDPNGNLLWHRSTAGPYGKGGQAMSVAVDDAGNVAMTGYATGGNGIGIDLLTVLYDADGNERWVRTFPSGWACQIGFDSSGSVLITGQSVGNDPNYDHTTIKYDSAGNELWVRRFSPAADSRDEVVGLSVGPDGGVSVSGHTETDGPWHFSTVRYDTDGNLLWSRVFDEGGSIPYEPMDVAADANGNTAVTGTFNDGGHGLLTVLYDASGNQKWAEVYDSPNWSVPLQVTFDGKGNVVVVGSSYSDSEDVLLVSYDMEGNERWTKRYVDSNGMGEGGRAVAVDHAGNLVVAGFGGHGRHMLTLKLSESNLPPAVDAGADRTFAVSGALTPVSLSGFASDPDDPSDSLELRWTLNGEAVAEGPSPTLGLPPGTHTLTLAATDPHGAVALDTVTVRVRYSWSGLKAPNRAKAGSAVPLQFSLTGASRRVDSAPARLFIVDPARHESLVGTFRCVRPLDLYWTVWRTKGLRPGEYRLRVDLGDGARRVTTIVLR